MIDPTRIGRWLRRFIVCAGAGLALAGCLELRTDIELNVDGSGSKTEEIIVVKRQLDQLGPGAAKEVEDRIRSDAQESVAADSRKHPGGRPPELSEYVDGQGNRVFVVKSEFRSLNEALEGEWSCTWEEAAKGVPQPHLMLRCQFARALATKLNESGMPIPYALRMHMPGRVVSTNGIRVSDSEIEWAFKSPPRANFVITGEVEKEGFPVRTFGIVVAGILAAVVLGTTGFWWIRRRRGCAAAAGEPAAANPAANACPGCGAPTTAGSGFCRSCGARLTVAQASRPVAGAVAACPKCAATAAVGARFCKSCGASLVATSAAATEPSAAAEMPPLPEAPLSEAATLPGGTTMPSAPAEPRRGLRMPAVATAMAALVVLGLGAWFGYAKWLAKPDASDEPQPPVAAAPAPPAAAFVPPVPMGRDPSNGCYVWRPDYLPGDAVRWGGACAGSLAEGPGRAEWTRASGPKTTFEGSFKAGYLEGAGRMTSSSGESYEGNFVAGRRDGQGRQVFATGDSYAGNWKADVIEGMGNMTYANGDRYEGAFKDDRREGHGVLVRHDGSRFEGEFRNDEPVGAVAPPADAARAAPAQIARAVPSPPAPRNQPSPKPAPAVHEPAPAAAAAAPPAAAPTAIDDQYSERAARECERGIGGLWCRERLKMKLCESHWSDSPPAGQSLCKRQEMPKEFGPR